MLRVFLYTCVLHVATCIIVTDPPPKAEYKYSYDIVDPTTGDTKSAYETKYGNQVRGSYSVIGSDGMKRIVDYTADDETGFNAVIRNELMTDKMLQHYNFHGVPYSSLYDSRNFNTQQIAKTTRKNVLIPLPYPSEPSKKLTFFIPYRRPPAEESFRQGELFKPSYDNN